ncbi:bola-like protein [Stemphylium lycopersici]|uniref:Bola-like protein n=1 Tax=Stemphylium lycopersici TaxID=183478 RepID=A0A364MUP0_STELY|nr:bola-like protein [Stemphylium lycopersici]RAQ99765.1 bola-like protein [Stemphylium lycopersici]RAR03779.1 bola-like protein [Stemphylium lycopersici]
MAPSRALLLRRIPSATVAPCLRPASRLLTTSATTLQRVQQPLALSFSLSRPPQLSKPCTRLYSQSASATPQAPDYLNEAELHVFNKIKAELEPAKLEVQDISGGCGSMYAIEIESPKFKGLTVIKQHKMVNQVLKDEIKSWHGVQLRTKAA